MFLVRWFGNLYCSFGQLPRALLDSGLYPFFLQCTCHFPGFATVSVPCVSSWTFLSTCRAPVTDLHQVPPYPCGFTGESWKLRRVPTPVLVMRNSRYDFFRCSTLVLDPSVPLVFSALAYFMLASVLWQPRVSPCLFVSCFCFVSLAPVAFVLVISSFVIWHFLPFLARFLGFRKVVCDVLLPNPFLEKANILVLGRFQSAIILVLGSPLTFGSYIWVFHDG